MSVKRLLIIGSMQLPDDCRNNHWCSEAMNRHQLALMTAFKKCGVPNVTGISFPGSYASRDDKHMHSGKISETEPGIYIRELPFWALGPLQIISQFLSLMWYLILTPRRKRPNSIIVINPLTRSSLPALLLGRLWRIPVVIIASDVRSETTSFLKRLRRWTQLSMIRLAPGVVVYSNFTGRDFRAQRPWIRMMCPPSPDVMDMRVVPLNRNTRNIYFSGSTNHFSGVNLLLDAIMYVTDPSYRFWFSGRGPFDNEIHAAAASDSRIVHFGFVSREKYLALLQGANVLVNPRPSYLLDNRYCFPSKLAEYMAADRPIISTDTGDVGEYYRDAIVLLEDETPEGLAKCIQEVCELPYEEQVRLGQRAREHVETESWEAQAQHILDFIETLQ
jgi:glycosyltransferase involved in cell wall biosynthesis